MVFDCRERRESNTPAWCFRVPSRDEAACAPPAIELRSDDSEAFRCLRRRLGGSEKLADLSHRVLLPPALNARAFTDASSDAATGRMATTMRDYWGSSRTSWRASRWFGRLFLPGYVARQAARKSLRHHRSALSRCHLDDGKRQLARAYVGAYRGVRLPPR